MSLNVEEVLKDARAAIKMESDQPSATSLARRGILAIIGMQAVAGITETVEQATVGWGGMSTSERKTTLRIASQMLPNGWDAD